MLRKTATISTKFSKKSLTGVTKEVTCIYVLLLPYRFNTVGPAETCLTTKPMFPAREETDADIRTAIEEIKENMGDERSRQSHRHLSHNTGRGHHRSSSDTSTKGTDVKGTGLTTNDSVKTDISTEKGQVNEAFVPDAADTQTHKRQGSSVSVESDMSSVLDQTANPLHKTR